MRAIISLLVVMLLAASLTACKKDKQVAAPAPAEQPAATAPAEATPAAAPAEAAPAEAAPAAAPAAEQK